jgi:hypothetical protein
MAADYPPAGEDLDALVAERILGLTVGFYLGLFGRGAYAVDTTAERTEHGTTRASLLGASWMTLTTEDGEAVEVYARGLPGYSRFVSPMWELVQFFDSYRLGWNALDGCHEAELTRYGPEAFGTGRGPSAAVAVCYAALDAQHNHPDAFPFRYGDPPAKSARRSTQMPTYGG